MVPPEAVSTTLPPVQKVFGPPAEIAAVGVLTATTVAALTAEVQVWVLTCCRVMLWLPVTDMVGEKAPVLHIGVAASVNLRTVFFSTSMTIRLPCASKAMLTLPP